MNREIVTKNLGLVGFFIRRVCKPGLIPWDDLYQEGCLGLMVAAQRHTPNAGKFSTYAGYWIRHYLYKYVQNQGVWSGGRSLRQRCFKLNSAEHKLTQELGHTPTVEQLAARLGVKAIDVISEMWFREPYVPLEDVEAVDPHTESNEYLEGLSEAASAFYESLGTKRKKAIWSERVMSLDPVNLQELGDRFRVSRERIRQIETDLIREFKRTLTALDR